MTYIIKKGLGASNMKKEFGQVLKNGNQYGRFSYNSRFWIDNKEVEIKIPHQEMDKLIRLSRTGRIE